MTAARHPDFPAHLSDPQPLEGVVKALGFVEVPLGYMRKWGDLEFDVCESIGCHFLIRSGKVTARTAWPPHEVRIFSPVAPIELMATIYRLWAEVHEQDDPPDTLLLWGKEWLDYQRELKKLIPPPPTIWAEREFLRHCLTYIERLHDWVDNDYDIHLSQVPGQLRIQARETEVFCPARGNWIGETIISAKELFRRLPKRFIGQVVMLQMESDRLRIDNRVLHARWQESDAGTGGEPQ